MSARLMMLVFALDLAPELKLVLLALASFADDDGGRVFPSVQTLAGRCSMSSRTVKRHLAALRAMGVLVTVAGGGGRGRFTRYRLDLAAATRPETVSPASRFAPAETVSPATETVSPVVRNGVTGDTRIVRESSERDSLCARADVAALLERWPKVTDPQLRVLDEILDRHDVSGPEWAAGIIRNTPDDADPLAAVMEGDRAWQRDRREQADLGDAAWLAEKEAERAAAARMAS